MIDKPAMTMLSYPALAEAAKAMMFGAEKHGRSSWLEKNSKTGKPMSVKDCLDAASRHIGKHQWVEEVDDESGLSHLAHALCQIMMALHYELEEKGRLDECPSCGGEADNGFDRCVPPNPYECTKCEDMRISGSILKPGALIYVDENGLLGD